ncbi:uncharacterized protein LOC113660633, partial [Tachysurus ichikawai]
VSPEPRTLKFYSIVLGNTMNIHQEFLRRLKQRLSLTEVQTEGNCDFIVAFVPIVSRAGTDIEAALQKIPTGKTVVLAALHFTFDENYIAPDSKWNINRSDVFAVDLLCYEDLGLLRSLRNDEALKAVTDHLITIGASFNTQLETSRSQRPCSPFVFVCICIVFGTKIRVFLRNQPEQLINIQNGIMDRLKRRLEIQLVDSVDHSDVSIAFVPIVSRAGTDIEAALRTIPTSPQQSVVLIVIHHTFDRDYIAPFSNWSVKREGVFAVHFLGHEDCGLLTCLANDMALKSLTDYLAPEAPYNP